MLYGVNREIANIDVLFGDQIVNDMFSAGCVSTHMYTTCSDYTLQEIFVTP